MTKGTTFKSAGQAHNQQLGATSGEIPKARRGVRRLFCSSCDFYSGSSFVVLALQPPWAAQADASPDRGSARPVCNHFAAASSAPLPLGLPSPAHTAAGEQEKLLPLLVTEPLAVLSMLCVLAVLGEQPEQCVWGLCFSTSLSSTLI